MGHGPPHTAILSLRPLADVEWLRANWPALLRAARIAALIYATIFLLHEPLIGATPWPV